MSCFLVVVGRVWWYLNWFCEKVGYWINFFCYFVGWVGCMECGYWFGVEYWWCGSENGSFVLSLWWGMVFLCDVGLFVCFLGRDFFFGFVFVCGVGCVV